MHVRACLADWHIQRAHCIAKFCQSHHHTTLLRAGPNISALHISPCFFATTRLPPLSLTFLSFLDRPFALRSQTTSSACQEWQTSKEMAAKTYSVAGTGHWVLLLPPCCLGAALVKLSAVQYTTTLTRTPSLTVYVIMFFNGKRQPDAWHMEILPGWNGGVATTSVHQSNFFRSIVLGQFLTSQLNKPQTGNASHTISSCPPCMPDPNFLLAC